MESQNIPMPAGPNEEHEASSSEEVHERPNNQFVSYHRTITDGSYVGVHLSPGFRFVPREEELIRDFLNMKINKQPPEYIQMISYVNVYKHTPEELAENNRSFGEDEWYFFSTRYRKYLNGDRPDRAAGNGYWKANGADKKFYDNDVCIGSMKYLVFHEGKPPKGKRTNWVMREYVANQPRRQPQHPRDMRLDDCVLCRIYHPRQKNIQGQHNLQVQPPDLPMQPQNLPVEQNIQGQHNLQLQPPNLQAGQYTLNMAGDHNVGRQLGNHLESAPEAARQIPDLNVAPYSSMGYLEPNLPSFNDNDHPQDGH